MSVATDVADAVVTAVTALALSGVTVAKRKTPSAPEGMALPLVAVSIGEEGECEYLTARKVMMTYPVAVTIVTANASPLQENGTIRTWRESIRKRMEAAATFAGVTGFNAVWAGGREPYDRNALAKDLNYSSLSYRVEVIEDAR